MGPDFYVVERIGAGRLLVMAKPTAGEWIEDEFAGLASAGVRQVVSLLERSEALELGLGDEEALCLANAMAFRPFPIPDRGVPMDSGKYVCLVQSLLSDIEQGMDTVVHCRAGIGRTGIVAAGVLVCAGNSIEQSLQKVSDARGVTVPDTQQQTEWLHETAVVIHRAS